MFLALLPFGLLSCPFNKDSGAKGNLMTEGGLRPPPLPTFSNRKRSALCITSPPQGMAAPGAPIGKAASYHNTEVAQTNGNTHILWLRTVLAAGH